MAPIANLDLPGWRVEYDRDATLDAYLRTPVAGPETCSCLPCRNWVATREQLIVAEFRQLLMQLGVPFNREIEVYHNARLETGFHSYGVWYHFVGRMNYGELELSPNIVYAGLSFYFHSKPVLLGSGFSKLPVVQLELTAEVPWLSELPEPG